MDLYVSCSTGAHHDRLAGPRQRRRAMGERVILRGAAMFDGTGQASRRGVAVVVEGDRIAAVEREGDIGEPASARTVDLTGCTLLPGLIDLHVHIGFGGHAPGHHPASVALRAARNVRTTLLAGITTLRDVGTLDAIVIALRDAVERGDVPGSRIAAAELGEHHRRWARIP